MSPSEEFPLQEFVYVIRSMSTFPLVPLCKCQSRLKVSVQINSPCRKKLFLSSFFFLTSAYTTSFFTEEC